MSRHAPPVAPSLRLPLLAGSAVALCFFAGLGRLGRDGPARRRRDRTGGRRPGRQPQDGPASRGRDRASDPGQGRQ